MNYFYFFFYYNMNIYIYLKFRNSNNLIIILFYKQYNVKNIYNMYTQINTLFDNIRMD